ncbi:L-type lectin-domain containing receptor kinase IV.1 [Ananas comosus]|uniref:non-specific serine/threonine protein kinase n=1 Tax=Ananas comosus TaxID=4615 RepID=A0A199V1N0_ANACO|nr:L-type lectin-domain containing receptor kinase IV.1 [Ananas comosus]
MGGAGRSLLRRLPTAAAAALFLLLLLPPTAHSQSTPKENVTFSFSSFDDSFRSTNLTVNGDSSIAQGALQITPDTLNQASYLVNRSGRVLYSQPFKLWEYTPANVNGSSSSSSSNNGNSSSSSNSNSNSNKYVASFSTSFTINVFRQTNTTPGEGIAFLIAPSLDAPPPGSDGGYLGLTNATLDGNASNHFVAVELDTVKQPYDPDDNHVGLDVNGVVSVANASLDLQIAPVAPANYTLWIDYDGGVRRIRVYMAAEGRPQPPSPVLDAPLDLGQFVLQRSYFGFSASTGSDYELNCVLAWNMTVERLRDKKRLPRWALGLAVGLPCAALLLGLIAGLYYVRRRRVGDDPSMLAGALLRSLPGTPREFDYKELKKATNNFDEKMKLGQGGFGTVYEGVLVGAGDNGETIEVAVKKFARANTKGQEEFLAELTIINRLRHRHLVRLIGWCHQNGELLLVYDYMPEGSLDQHLFGGPEKPLLNWARRYNVLSGVASALHYLHNEYDQRVVHRDLKASNVMLDRDFNARLGDFGLARALDVDRTSYADLELDGVPGTLGYIAPECFHTGKAPGVDVYGFGAVILEVVCGLRPRCEVGGFHYLVDWVWSCTARPNSRGSGR